jgi:hypothetical protein
MPTYDVTVTVTIEAEDQDFAMAKVGDTLTGMRRNKIKDIHFEETRKVKA